MEKENNDYYEPTIKTTRNDDNGITLKATMPLITKEEMDKKEDCWYGSTLILADDKRQVLIENYDKLQELKRGNNATTN